MPAHTRAYTAQRPLAPSWRPTSGCMCQPTPTSALMAPSPSATPPNLQPTATHTMPPCPPLFSLAVPHGLFYPLIACVIPISLHGTRQQGHGLGITAPAASRPLAKDASCSVSKAATTRHRARWSESELSPLGSQYPLPPTWVNKEVVKVGHLTD